MKRYKNQNQQNQNNQQQVQQPQLDTNNQNAYNQPTPVTNNQPSNPQPTAGLTHKLKCEEAQFVKILNLYRAQNKASALTVSWSGVQAARWHAQDMGEKKYFSHTEPGGRDFSSRAAAFGFGGWAENIAAGNSTAEATFCQWKNSPGHNSNMLGSHSSLGVGAASTSGSQYGTYWNTVFGGASDIIAEPLTSDAGCSMPSTIPGC